MQANNSKQKGNTVSKKKAGLENKLENLRTWAYVFLYNMRVRKLDSDNCLNVLATVGSAHGVWGYSAVRRETVDDGGNSACSRGLHGSAVEQLCWIVHRPQCRTVHQTLVYPASAIQDAGAVYHWVDALAIRRLGETAPCAGGVRQTSDDGSWQTKQYQSSDWLWRPPPTSGALNSTPTNKATVVTVYCYFWAYPSFYFFCFFNTFLVVGSVR